MRVLALRLLTVFSVLPSLHAATIELTVPTDQIVAVDKDLANPDNLAGNTTNFPVGQAPANAIDNTLNKYLNFEKENSGFIVQPNRKGLLSSIQFTTAGDAQERDPVTYTLEGTRNAGITWAPISSGSTGLSGLGRNTLGPNILVTNTTYYSAYRVVFPTLFDSAAANSMQVAEVDLLGNNNTFFTPFPSSLISSITAVGNSAFSANESPANLFDGNTGTKLYNDLNEPGGFDGFTYNINVTQPTLVGGLRLATGNDNSLFNGRNATAFTLRGSNNGGATFTDIVTTASPNLFKDQYYFDFLFNNSTAYSSYQISFPSLYSGSGLQLSELQFLPVPEPGRVLLLAAGMLGIFTRRRRKE